MRYGACESGCPVGAKASTDITHWRDAIKLGAQLVTGARVSRLTVDEPRPGHRRRVHRPRRQPAPPGGAGNDVGGQRDRHAPAPAQLATSAQFPDGLANSSGLVGKRLMIHPYASVYGAYDEDMESRLGPAGQALQSLQFYETDDRPGIRPRRASGT